MGCFPFVFVGPVERFSYDLMSTFASEGIESPPPLEDYMSYDHTSISFSLAHPAIAMGLMGEYIPKANSFRHTTLTGTKMPASGLSPIEQPGHASGSKNAGRGMYMAWHLPAIIDQVSGPVADSTTSRSEFIPR